MPITVIACEDVLPEDLPAESTGNVYMVHIKINDIKVFARKLVHEIGDTSWVNQLGILAQLTYRATVNRTALELVELFKTVDSSISSEFGEYAISLSATHTLNLQYRHKKVPLSELWKSRRSGNPGFDFHTESTDERVVFGEAKYKSRGNAYVDAAEQVLRFLDEEKHYNDIQDLVNFVNSSSIENLQENQKGIALAFSLNSKNKWAALERALKHKHVIALMDQADELYLLGVEI